LGGLLLGRRRHRDLARLVEPRVGDRLAEEIDGGDVLADGGDAPGHDLADREGVAARRALEELLEREVRLLLLRGLGGRGRGGLALRRRGPGGLGALAGRALLLAATAAPALLLRLALASLRGLGALAFGALGLGAL